MNSPNCDESFDSPYPNSSFTDASSSNEELINAEIIEYLSHSSSHNEQVTNLVYSSASTKGENALSASAPDYLEATDLSLFPTPTTIYLESLLTPWGMTSIALLLLANLLLSWAKFDFPQPVATTPLMQSPDLSLAFEKSQSLDLDSLSTLPVSFAIAPKSPIFARPPLPQNPQLQLPRVLASTQSKTNLTKAVRPHIIPSSAAPPATVPVMHPPTIAQSIPSFPSAKTVPVAPPSSPTASESAKAAQDIIIQQTFDRLQTQANTPPVGFNNETRLRRQAVHNNNDPRQLVEQLQQLQQQGNLGNRQ